MFELIYRDTCQNEACDNDAEGALLLPVFGPGGIGLDAIAFCADHREDCIVKNTPVSEDEVPERGETVVLRGDPEDYRGDVQDELDDGTPGPEVA